MSNTFAKCPHCEDEDLYYEKFTVEEVEGPDAFFFARGVCPSCGRKYHWVEKYAYVEVSYMEEDV